MTIPSYTFSPWETLLQSFTQARQWAFNLNQFVKKVQDQEFASANTTLNRPTGTTAGYMYYDTTLGQPIWSDGAGNWVDATGTGV